MKLTQMFALTCALSLLPGLASANTDEEQAVQNAMKAYVKRLTQDDGVMPIVHQGQVLQLKLHSSDKYPDGFHAGVQKDGALYASCADFVDAVSGDKYDIDFLVKRLGTGFEVIQPIVHSVNGKKSPYDLEH